MTDEWIERRVVDLEVGDDVKDYGIVCDVRVPASWMGNPEAERYVVFEKFQRYLLNQARVDIRRPTEVRVITSPSGGEWHRVYIADALVGGFHNKAHAEEYAARLRSSAHDRAAALGKDTP